jgi:bifunctional non-homologous end joining protein LigD
VPSGRKGLTRGKTVIGGRSGANTIAPMLATLGSVQEFEGGADWAYEMKWDGIRAVATIQGDEVTLRTRNGLDVTGSYPELAETLPEAVRGGAATLDGEIVALDAKGRPSFGLLQQRMGLSRPGDVERARGRTPVNYFVFDVLDEPKLPYAERRARLEREVHDSGPIVVPPDAGTDLKKALATSAKLGLEGVMAKRLDSPYRVGKRSRDWIKLKHHKTQEVVIGGWRPGNGARASTVGSLLLGVKDGDTFRYVGRVGTGFADRELQQLRARLDRIARKTSPLEGVPAADARDVHWVTPSLVGEVEYAELTTDGRLRQPSWRGWRSDKDPDQVVRELA